DGKTDERSVYRLIGAFDGTNLEYQPAPPAGAPTTIDAGEVAEFIAEGPFVITGDQPFSLVEFLFSNGSLGYGAVPGDPAMWVVPPVEQFEKSYVFLAPQGYD